MTYATIDSARWIRRFCAAPESPVQLACLPHAGGSATYFLPVAQALSPAIDVLAVQYPGRQDRRAEPGVDNLQELAAQIYEPLRAWAERPLALFGHSMGATLAFEVARLMEADGVPPAHLFLSGRRAPTQTREERVHLLDDAGLIAELRRLDGTQSEVLEDEELLRMVLDAVRTDYRAVETYVYRPGPPLESPMTVLVGDADPTTTLEEAQAWRDFTRGAFDLRVFTGGHFFLTAHQTEILRLITARLSTA